MIKRLISLFIFLTFISFLSVTTASALSNSTDISNNSPYTYNENLRVAKKPTASQKRDDKSYSDTTIEDNFSENNSLIFEGETHIDELSMTSTSTTTISSSSGGTLFLDYTGELSNISNIIYTRVIYLPAEQVVFLQHAINSGNALDDTISYLMGIGTRLITDSITKEIAKLLGISSTITSVLTDLSIGYVVYCLNNLEEWDLTDAIENSTTGKIKIVYYYYTNSISYPYYMEYEVFEPWNSSNIDIPEDYDYIWLNGSFVYEYGDPDCTHSYINFTSQNSTTHASACEKCDNVEVFTHNFQTSASINLLYHEVVCTDCGYSKNERHLCSWQSQDAYSHIGLCSLCGFTKTGYHSDNYNEILGICNTCGYKGAVSLRSIFSKSPYVRE
ncbi:MAG: hypothetical protein IJW53_04760 [Clostridia bacterium]|nr:hypothetical protein [Clostridia bacterium]